MILGLNAFHGDSSACIVRDGKLVAAIEEERLRRIKHWAGFPSESIRYCLEEAKADLGDVDLVAVNQDSGSNFWRNPLLREGLIFKTLARGVILLECGSRRSVG